MTDALERLRNALAERYAIQEELGAGGMGPQITQKRAEARR
jgi:hypothetical protein